MEDTQGAFHKENEKICVDQQEVCAQSLVEADLERSDDITPAIHTVAHDIVMTVMADTAYPHAEAFPQLIEAVSSYMDVEDLQQVQRAYLLARECHKDQRRRSSEPYIMHPVEVALILTTLHMDADTISAALLHDVVEDTNTTLDDVERMFNDQVALMVDGVTKLTNIEVDSLSDEQAQNMRKMFLAMSKDIRVIIIKLADRLHNMRTMMALREDRRIFKARETRDIYAPLASRLGISSIKWELEDLAFFYLEPTRYHQINRMVAESRAARESYLQKVIDVLSAEMQRNHIKSFQISGRPKHLWSIYQKMKNKGKDFSEIYDLIAIRVITDSLQDCYSVLGAAHALWHPMPGRFKDYIAMPKNNMYQSLHTTVIGPTGRPLEIQIRTQAMHQQAEYGIAAHWLYKESGGSNPIKRGGKNEKLDIQLAWLKRTLEWADQDVNDSREYLDALKVDLFGDEVFVFSPKGDVISLRQGSTPIDFAYAIHTEVGHHCVGAKVNMSVVPLSYELQNGDRIEILTQKNSNPSRDWLSIVKTPSARSKIRAHFSKITRSDDQHAGRELLGKELRKRGYGINSSRSMRAIREVAQSMSMHGEDDLFAAVGGNKTTPRLVANKICAILEKTQDPSVEAEKRALLSLAVPMKAPRHARVNKKSSNGVLVDGGSADMLVHLARCCSPVPGDDIIGFVTRGRGVSVHRSNCPNVQNLMQHPERTIRVEWDSSKASAGQVEIIIDAVDRMRLLQDVSICIGDEGANILSASTNTQRDGTVRMRFLIELGEIARLDHLLMSCRGLEGVFGARRLNPGEGAQQEKHTYV